MLPENIRKPLVLSENLWFSDAFSGHKKRPVALNGLHYFWDSENEPSLQNIRIKQSIAMCV